MTTIEVPEGQVALLVDAEVVRERLRQAHAFEVACLAAALRVDLPPRRIPVSRDTPLGTEIECPDETTGCTLAGWKRNGKMLYEFPSGAIHADDLDGWYVVEGGDQ